MDSKNYLVKVALLLALIVPVCGCHSGKTNESGTSDYDSVFVGEGSGSIGLDVDDVTLPVGQTSPFIVTVKDKDGRPVPNSRVACDSEAGIAIIDPATGLGITSDSGRMSGILGCELPGSYRFGCRLPVGGNFRKFVSIRCTGDTPEGFTGWPNAAGGGLGGAGSIDIDSAGSVKVSSVYFVSSTGEAGTVLDTKHEAVCEDTEGSEPFGNDYVVFKFKNGKTEAVTIETVRFEVEGYQSPEIPLYVTLAANDDEGTAQTVFLKVFGGGKAYYGSTVALPEADTSTKTVSFTFKGVTKSGERVSLSSKASVSVGPVDNC